MVQINWTNDAKQDLRNIYEYIAQDSAYYAELTILKIVNKLENLQNNVKIGKMIREKQDPQFREILYKQYRIMYKVVEDDRVDILNIFHSSKNFDLNFL